MYCRDCGNELKEGAIYCPECGSRQNVVFVNTYDPDTGSLWWAILGFILPPLGFILWVLWMENKPKCARMSFLGSAISIAAFASFHLMPLLLKPIIGIIG